MRESDIRFGKLLPLVFAAVLTILLEFRLVRYWRAQGAKIKG